MEAQPSTYQANVTVWFRGPEYAFAVPQGDFAALERVMTACSGFWNGANSIIIPVSRRGTTWPVIREFLEVHRIETCLIDPGVPPASAVKLKDQLGSMVGEWAPFVDDLGERELPAIHPGWAAQPADLNVPLLGNQRLRRIGLACWGHIHPDLGHYYQQQFRLIEKRGEDALRALITGQFDQTSPLELTRRGVRTFQTNGSFERTLYVFRRGSFNELVEFWNLRARSRSHAEKPLQIGVPNDALTPVLLAGLPEWIESQWGDVDPDVGICAQPADEAIARKTVQALGFKQDKGHRIRMRFESRRSPDRPLSYGCFAPTLGGPLKRGIPAPAQLTFVGGQASFRPPRPEGFGPRSAHYIRLSVEDLPLALPLTNAMAREVTHNGTAAPEGVTIKTNAWAGDGYVNLVAPEPWRALELWAAERRYQVSRSDGGRYAQALIDRRGGPAALGSLATSAARKTLEALAPTSRKKLARRIVRQAAREEGAKLDEVAIAEQLKQATYLADLPARTASDIGGTGLGKAVALTTLSALVDDGFVRRGRAVRCPICGHSDVLLIGELDERVACRACRVEFALPVLSGRSEEDPWVYRLDGLMARAMDQDLLPELLCLRTLATVHSRPRAAWNGIVFTRGETKIEVDALVSDGHTVYLAEAKLTAGSLGTEQCDKLVALADELGARPVIAALDGTFDREVVKRLPENGLVVGPSALLAA